MTSTSEAACSSIAAPIGFDYAGLGTESSNISGNSTSNNNNNINAFDSLGLSQMSSSQQWIGSPHRPLPRFSTPSDHITDLQTHQSFCSESLTGTEIEGERESTTPTAQTDVFGNSFITPNNMDMTTDFSFLHRRPASSCSQSMKQYIHSRASSSAGMTDASTTPESTPRKRERCSKSRSDVSMNNIRRPLSQQRQRKTTSESVRQGSFTGRSARSNSSTPMRNNPSIFANTKKLPLRLPKAPLCLISDPYADLASHLRKHGMDVEADSFASASGITAEYALRGWIQTTEGGSIGLLNQTNLFLDRHAEVVKTQLEMSKHSENKSVPTHFTFPIHALDAHADEYCITPTHILAVHGIGSFSKASIREEESKGILIPCHALMYALQCVSLPAFPTSTARQEGETRRSLPVVSLRVPRPAEYPTLHRFVYTHDASALLVELLPMKHIARHWDHLQTKQQREAPGSTTAPSSATDALSHLPTQTLLGYAYKIHSAWANGVAIGLLEAKYWSTLDRAWNLILAALSIKKARILDAELKASQFNMGKARV